MSRIQLLTEISKLINKPYIDQIILNKFILRINSGRALTKSQGIVDHFCTFFLPVNQKTKSIYLVHHIKANDWIPPGGHIDQNELSIDTVNREFKEELDYRLNKERIEIFDLSIKQINRPHQNCMVHYDIWYLVFTDKIPFNFLEKEFHNAGWFDLNKGVEKIKLKKYRDIVKKLRFVL